MWSKRLSLKVLLMSLLLGISCVAMAADAPAPSVYFWNSGGSSTQYAKSPAKWGNGSATTSRRVQFDTLNTLQVTTKNLHEGIRFDLNRPLDITPYMGGNGFLRLRVQFNVTGRPNMGGDAPGGFGGGGFGGRGRRGAPLMQPLVNSAAQLPPFGGAPGNPDGGFNTMPAGPPRETTKIDNLQVKFVLERGTMSTTINIAKQRGSEDQVDGRRLRADDDGWILFIVPMKSFVTTPGAGGNLQRVILTSDNEDTFYLSQLALVTSNDNMSVSIRRQNEPVGTQQAEITVKPGRITFVADVESGDGDPQVTWNFDADNANRQIPTNQPQQFAPEMAPDAPYDGQSQAPVGPPVDARGLVASHVYPNQEQNYRVEVTVHDRTGKNPDVKAMMLVKVRNGD